jgi:Undecaprenyl-phosphate glucose phosphotransferase
MGESARTISFGTLAQAAVPQPIERSRRLSSKIIVGITKISDFATVLLSAVLAFVIYIVFILNDERAEPVALTAVLGSTLFVAGFHTLSGYSFKRLSAFRWQASRIALVWAGALAMLLMLAFITKVSGSYSRGWSLTWAGLTFVLLLLDRAVLCLAIRRWWRRGYFARNVIVVGAGEQGERLLAKLRASAGKRIAIVGVFDDRLTRIPRSVGGYDVLGTVDDLLTFAGHFPIDEIIVALPLVAERRLKDIFDTLNRLPVDIRLSAETLSAAFPVRGISHLAHIPMLKIVNRPLKHWSGVIKWSEDKVLAALLLAILAPVMATIALLIRLDSPGPIFFVQQRFGFGNRAIRILKFRTMYADKGDASGGQRTLRNDPRVTRVGRLLRLLSLDELPQLINVLRGEMSLVGPRPHAITMKAGDQFYYNAIKQYLGRHRVKPGITGWAQIHGQRGEIDNLEKAQLRVVYDLEYIERWSIWLDLKILFMTFRILLSRENAY